MLISGFGYSQSAKFGHIDSNEILGLMPETDSLQNEYKAYAEYLDQQMNSMAMEYQTKVTEYQNNLATMSDLIRQTKEKEITDLQGALVVGVTVEETDIGTLTDTIEGELGEMPDDVINTYYTLREGSYNHLESFNARLERV